MTNHEQVKLLKHSVQEWNVWRQYSKVWPDLRRADFNHASLNHANLSYADLSYADLNHTDFNRANLNHADLGDANLSYADLSDTDLSYADLSYANLNHTSLTGASLSSASFSQTRFFRTLFAWVDLGSVKELETAEHLGPSIVDINSVILPHDEPTRLHFLHGAGFTQTQIEYLPALLTPRPIEYSSLFISYAHQDQTLAKRLYTDLRKKEVPCWFAPHDLRPGTPILRSIEEAIHLHDKFLLILSKHAVESRWIEREVDAVLH
jgi:hypothetical protein